MHHRGSVHIYDSYNIPLGFSSIILLSSTRKTLRLNFLLVITLKHIYSEDATISMKMIDLNFWLVPKPFLKLQISYEGFNSSNIHLIFNPKKSRGGIMIDFTENDYWGPLINIQPETDQDFSWKTNYKIQNHWTNMYPETKYLIFKQLVFLNHYRWLFLWYRKLIWCIYRYYTVWSWKNLGIIMVGNVDISPKGSSIFRSLIISWVQVITIFILQCQVISYFFSPDKFLF